MTTIKRQDAMAALKEVMKTLNLELSVSDAEYMVPWTFCEFDDWIGQGCRCVIFVSHTYAEIKPQIWYLESLRSNHVGFHGLDLIQDQTLTLNHVAAVLLVGVCNGDAAIFLLLEFKRKSFQTQDV